MIRYEENFKSKLMGLNFNTIENSLHSIFGLSNELKLIYFNLAWLEFAKSNNGEPCISQHYPIGTSIEAALCGKIKDFYVNNYNKVIQESKVWTHEYECSSSGVYRLFYQEVFPLKNREGVIVVNSLRTEQIIDEDFRKVSTYPMNEYISSTGMITQCSNCRKIQRVNQQEIWDWVPALIEEGNEYTSHSICPVCYDYYWKK